MRPHVLLPLLAASLLLPAAGRGEITAQADAIAMLADTLPRFTADPWGLESEGNPLSGVVRRVFQDRDGDFWFATQDGIARYDGTSLVYFDLRDEYGQGITGYSIAQDPDGLLWFGSSAGLIRFDGTTFVTYTEADGLPSSDAWGVLVDSRGTLWINTLRGACRREADGFVPFPLPASTRTERSRGVWDPHVVWRVTEDRAGDLWFVTEGGLYRYDGETVTRVPVLEETTPTWVNGVLEDSRGTLWITTMHKGILRREGDAFVSVTEREGLAGTEAGGILEDRAGNVWIPVENVGVYRFAADGITLFGKEQGLPAGSIHAAYEDAAGRIWFFGFGGAWRTDGTTVVEVTRDGPW